VVYGIRTLYIIVIKGVNNRLNCPPHLAPNLQYLLEQI